MERPLRPSPCHRCRRRFLRAPRSASRRPFFMSSGVQPFVAPHGAARVDPEHVAAGRPRREFLRHGAVRTVPPPMPMMTLPSGSNAMSCDRRPDCPRGAGPPRPHHRFFASHPGQEAGELLHFTCPAIESSEGEAEVIGVIRVGLFGSSRMSCGQTNRRSPRRIVRSRCPARDAVLGDHQLRGGIARRPRRSRNGSGRPRRGRESTRVLGQRIHAFSGRRHASRAFRETARSPAMRRMISIHWSLLRPVRSASWSEWQLSHWITRCFCFVGARAPRRSPGGGARRASAAATAA